MIIWGVQSTSIGYTMFEYGISASNKSAHVKNILLLDVYKHILNVP